MSNICLRKAFTEPVLVNLERRPVLYAVKCDCCGKVFARKHLGGGDECFYLSGIFNSCAGTLGNMFHADVCSFKCADKLFNGGWKKIPEYKNFKRAKCELEWCKLTIMRPLVERQELLEQWETQEPKKYSNEVGK